MSTIHRRGVLLDGIGKELVRSANGGSRKTLSDWIGSLQNSIELEDLAETFTSGDATPDVSGSSKWITAGSTAITNFDGGTEGQVIHVYRGDSDIAITDNGNIDPIIAGNLTLSAARPSASFRLASGVWKQVAEAGALSAAMTPVVQAASIDAAMEMLDQGAFTATGGSTARNLATRFAERVNLKDFGAVGDGSTDDTTAIQAWLAAITAGKVGYAPNGTYKFTSALSSAATRIAIIGDGPFQTVFKYAGASTTADLLTIGDGSTVISNHYLHGFRIASDTTMSSGNALRLRRMQRGSVSSIVIDGESGNKKLYHGIYFDEMAHIDLIDFEVHAQGDGIRCRGTAAGGQAGLMLFQGKVTGCAVGFRVGGGMGGVYADQVDIIGNGVNLLIDTTLQAEANREFIFGPAFALDSSTTGANLQISDTLATGSSSIQMNGTWVASSAQDGILIDANVAMNVLFTGGTLIANARDGIRNNSTSAIIVASPARCTSSGGYGINSTVSNANIYVDGAAGYWAGNSSGNVNANVVISVLVGQSGVLSFGASPRPIANDGAALGTASLSWSDLFLASGGVINWNNGDVTITHAANALAFAGASVGYTFDALVSPAANDGAPLGSATVSWSDLFLASGAVINFNNGDVVLTHSSDLLKITGGAFEVAADLVVSTTASAPGPTQGVLKFTNTFSTTRNKYLRMGSDNVLTMINSGFSAVIASWDDNGSFTAAAGTAIPAGGTAGVGLLVSSTANFGIFFGSGAPSLSAAQGSLYLRSDGSSTSTRLYVNSNGSTGWTNVTTAT